MSVTVAASALAAALAGSATAGGDAFDCSGCIDKGDIGAAAVGTGEIVNGTIELADLDGATKSALRTRLWAQNDGNVFSQLYTNTSGVEINELTGNAPAQGFLLISGSAVAQNPEASAIEYTLVPKLDGDEIALSWAAREGAAASGSSEARVMLNYSIATPVDAGAFTVTQELVPSSSPVDISVNGPTLTVLYVKTGGITAT